MYVGMYAYMHAFVCLCIYLNNIELYHLNLRSVDIY